MLLLLFQASICCIHTFPFSPDQQVPFSTQQTQGAGVLVYGLPSWPSGLPLPSSSKGGTFPSPFNSQ